MTEPYVVLRDGDDKPTPTVDEMDGTFTTPPDPPDTETEWFDGIPAPSRVRDRIESRIRKLAATYPEAERIEACRESAAMLTEYADKLDD
jgi:hypothetical protein